MGACVGSRADIVDGLTWASGLPVPGVPNNPTPAKVINISIGGAGACDKLYQEAINKAVAQGAFIAVAAGNETDSSDDYSPASCLGVMTVAATGQGGDAAPYSNSPGLDMTALFPGQMLVGGASVVAVRFRTDASLLYGHTITARAIRTTEIRLTSTEGRSRSGERRGDNRKGVVMQPIVQRSSVPGVIFAACVLALSATSPAQDSASGGQPPAKNSSGMVIAAPATGGPLTPSKLESAEMVFNRFDTGRRGYLTKDQVQSLDGYPFDAVDTNHDGKLTADEFNRGWEQFSAKK